MSAPTSRFTRLIRDVAAAPLRAWRLVTHGGGRLDEAASQSRRAARSASHLHSKTSALGQQVAGVDEELRAVRGELRAVRKELRDRLLQYHLQLGRLAQGGGARAGGSRRRRLSGRTVPVELPAAAAVAPTWEPIRDAAAPDPAGVEWLAAERCPACGHPESTVVSPWNKLILLARAPDQQAARYDYAVCHGCGILFASRRPVGERYRFLLAHFGEVTAKRGEGGEIENPVLYPYPLDDGQRERLKRLAARGVFVSDHLNLPSKEYLAGLLRDRFENSGHADLLGSLLSPRGARVLEVRSRAGTILDALRRHYDAKVYAMPIWESQQVLVRSVYGIETSELIDFDEFRIPFDEPFDLIICNHMFTHVLRPAAFFAELRRRLAPGGHIYLHNEPDDAEFLRGKQSMLATLNPLHLQAFDQKSLIRALAAHGFETVFAKRRNLNHLCLARLAEPRTVPMTARERDSRVALYQRAYDRAVLGIDERLRPRVAGEWKGAVERGVAGGTVEFDEDGRLRLVGR